jgi:hypothetical protein
VKCISLYGVLRGCQIAESLAEPDYYPEVGISPPIHAALGSRLQSLSRRSITPLLNRDNLFSRELAQAMLGESGVQRAREILGRINQSAVEIGKKPTSLGGLLPGVSEQSLDELVFE